MDIAQLAGLDFENVTIAARVYRIGELTLGQWAPVQAWIKAHAPRPLASLRSEDLAGLQPEDRVEILKMAYAETKVWPPRLGSRAWFQALDEPGGHAVLVFALVGKHQPEIPFSECERIATATDLPTIVTMVLAGLGATNDPKSPASAATTRTAAKRTSRSRRRPTTSAPSPSSSPRLGDGPETKSSN